MAVKVRQHKGAWWVFIDHYGRLVPGDNRQAVDKLNGLEQTTIRNPTATDHEDAPMDQDATAQFFKSFSYPSTT